MELPDRTVAIDMSTSLWQDRSVSHGSDILLVGPKIKLSRLGPKVGPSFRSGVRTK